MQKNKLNLHIYGIHLLNPYKTVVSHLKLVVGSLLCSERFFSGFPLPSKIKISKFQFDRMQDLPENHFRVSGASWVNINNYKPSNIFAHARLVKKRHVGEYSPAKTGEYPRIFPNF